MISKFKEFLSEKEIKQKYIENIDDTDMENYFTKLYNICLHMKLNDPEINVVMSLGKEQSYNSKIKEKLEKATYKTKDYYCVDGFPKEGQECVVIIGSPTRDQYIY